MSSLRTVPMFNSVTFNKDQYVSVNSLPNMLNDLYRFCVVGNSIPRIDTTFELVDGLWLTDTTYTNEALVDLKGKHPEFPGPKDQGELSQVRWRTGYPKTRAAGSKKDRP